MNSLSGMQASLGIISLEDEKHRAQKSYWEFPKIRGTFLGSP